MSEKPSNIMDWLKSSIRDPVSRERYISNLRLFAKSVYGDNCVIQWENSIASTKDPEERKRKSKARIEETELIIDKYMKEDRLFLTDLKLFINWMNEREYASGSIHQACSKVKKFLDRQDTRKYTLEKRDWDDIKTGLLPEKVTETQDDILEKDEMKLVFSFLPLNGKALFSLCKDTGARINAVLQLKNTDINLDANPPYANLQPKYTKKGIGGRRIWFTPETKEFLISWLILKQTKAKKRGGFYARDMVFGFSYGNARCIWNTALRKAGLEKRDSNTKQRVRVYHIHTLRKFFRSQMAESGMPELYVHGLMGHKGYLDKAYARQKRVMEMYVKHMRAVELSPLSDVQLFKRQTEELIAMKEKIKEYGGVEGFLSSVDSSLFPVSGGDTSEKLMNIFSKMLSKEW